ncbi:MAG: hypothetical protein WBS54_13790 [Acidobacteriota bacterium]
MTLEQLLSSTKRRLGVTMISAALSLGAMGSQIIPYLNQNAKVTALNASAQTITVTATYAPMGQDPRNGTPETVTLTPGQSGTLANPLTQEGSAYVTSTGDDAVLTASIQHTDGSGMNIPVLPANAKNNEQPEAGILANGMQWEREIVLSGDSSSNNTLNHQAYGPDGTGPANASPEYVPPGLISPAYVGDIFNGGLPLGSTDTLIPQVSDQSKAGGLLLYTSPVSGDTRLRTMQNFTTAQQNPADVAKAYVQQWLPPNDSRFYLNNEEARAIINGDGEETPSYATDLATILANSSGANGQTIDQLTQWLQEQADCNLSNGELLRASDPLYWTNASYGTKGFALFEEGASTAGFPLDPTDLQAMYSLIKDQFLWRFVMDHPELYGGSVGGLPDISHDPTWYTGDTNDFTCP